MPPISMGVDCGPTIRASLGYSHSMVPGGLLVMS